MKHAFLFLALNLMAYVSFAAVFTVDNNPGAPAAFSVANDAIAAMNEGDTLYVQPSPTSYGDVSIDKRIVLLGAGHNPENTMFSSEITNLNFLTGSSASVVKGIFLSNYLSIPSYNIVSDVVISHNFMTGQNIMGAQIWAVCTSWIFENNVIASTSNYISLGGNFTNGTIFRNNIFNYVTGSAFYAAAPGTIFDHNIFIFAGNSTFDNLFSNGSDVSITNNIIYATSPIEGTIETTCSGCFWENNMTYSINGTFTNLPGNNYNNVDPLFVNVPDASAYFTYANDYGLTALSPALGAANDGTDVGLFGGVGQFNRFGFDPSLPRLGEVNILNATAPVNGTITIHVRGFASGN